MASGSQVILRSLVTPLIICAMHSFSFGIWAENTADAISVSIKVLTSPYPPYTVVSEDGQVSGISTKKVRLLMERAGLKYEILVMPWSRALRVVAEDPHALIYSLDRTEERETEFRWLIELNQVENGLIGRKGLIPEGFNTAQAISGEYKAVCSMGSSKCELLRQYGFAPGNILRVAGSGSENMVNLILRGRAAFAVEDPKVLFWHVRHIEGVADLQVYDGVGDGTTDYLAAGLSGNPAMINALLDQISDGKVLE